MSYYYYAKGNCNGRRNQSCIAACCWEDGIGRGK
jgi:hypothetical protein